MTNVQTNTPTAHHAENIENAIEGVRAELGNAGFAAQVGMTDLAIEAVDEAITRLNLLRMSLRINR